MQRALIAFMILAVLTVVFSIQNSVDVQIKFLFWESNLPLALIIVISLALGTILGVLFSIPKKKKKEINDISLIENKNDSPLSD